MVFPSSFYLKCWFYVTISIVRLEVLRLFTELNHNSECKEQKTTLLLKHILLHQNVKGLDTNYKKKNNIRYPLSQTWTAFIISTITRFCNNFSLLWPRSTGNKYIHTPVCVFLFTMDVTNNWFFTLLLDDVHVWLLSLRQRCFIIRFVTFLKPSSSENMFILSTCMVFVILYVETTSPLTRLWTLVKAINSRIIWTIINEKNITWWSAINFFGGLWFKTLPGLSDIICFQVGIYEDIITSDISYPIGYHRIDIIS